MFDYDDFTSRIDDALVLARYWSRNSDIFVTAASYEFGLGNDHDALREVIGAVDSLQRSVDSLAPYRNLLYGLWNLERLSDGIRDDFDELCNGGVDMESIIDAMFAATDEEYKYFIGLVDAYRVALWNQPFNAEFYAALARGFAGVQR